MYSPSRHGNNHVVWMRWNERYQYPGQALESGGLASFPPQEAVFHLAFPALAGSGTIKMLPLRSLRWE